MRFVFTIIFFIFYNNCNAQNSGFNYNNLFPYKAGRIIDLDTFVSYHPYFDTTLICIIQRNKPFEMRDSSFNLLETGTLNFTCSQRCSRINLWNEYYESGEIKASGIYKKDQKINKWKYFHKNGNLMRFEDYPYDNDYKFSFDNPYYQSQPFLIAEYEYYENGQLKMEGQYSTSVKCMDSVYVVDPETGIQTLEIIESSCSKKCGTWNYYFPDGSLMKKEEY